MQCVVASGGESRVVAVSPSLPRVVLPGSVASMAAVAAIPVVTTEATSEVSLVAPPPPAAVEEEKETETPTTLSGGLHGSPSWSELKTLEGDTAGIELERPSVAHETNVVEIPSDDEADDVVELPTPSQELAVVRSVARPSGRLEEGDLEWPCPEDPSKVRFILWDSQECQL